MAAATAPESSERPPVIFDFGSRFIKAGIAGEYEPRVILSSFQFLVMTRRFAHAQSDSTKALQRLSHNKVVPKAKEIVKHPMHHRAQNVKHIHAQAPSLSTVALLNVDYTEEEWIHILSASIRRIYVEYLLVCPLDQNVIICEGIVVTKNFRRAVASVLLDNLQVKFISYVPRLLTPLFTCGMHTGIVVDIGYNDCQIMPTYHGSAMYSQHIRINVGGKLVDNELRKLLRNDQATPELAQVVSELSDEDIEDIKVRCCYVAYSFEDIELPEASADSDLNISAENAITVGKETRWKACEVLFGNEFDEMFETSIQYGILKCLEMCPIDCRKELAQNIIICGGTAELKGLFTRLAIELSFLLQNHKTLKNLENYVIFALPPFRPLWRQWSGASIYGTKKKLQTFSREAFLQGNAIPEWINWRNAFIKADIH